jgi:hypothetical protein
MNFKPWNENRLIIAQTSDFPEGKNKGKKDSDPVPLSPIRSDGLFIIELDKFDTNEVRANLDDAYLNLEIRVDPKNLKNQNVIVDNYFFSDKVPLDLRKSLIEQAKKYKFILPTDSKGDLKYDFEFTAYFGLGDFTKESKADSSNAPAPSTPSSPGSTPGKGKLVQYNFPIEIPVLKNSNRKVEIYLTYPDKKTVPLSVNHPNETLYPLKGYLPNGNYVLSAFTRAFLQKENLRSVRQDFYFEISNEGIKLLKTVPEPGTY